MRSIRLHLVLLILTLATAWLTFRAQLTADSTSDEERVVLLQAAEGEVGRLDYESDGRMLRVESRLDDEGRWFEGSETVAVEGRESETKVFRAGASAETLWRQLEPLTVSRVLGHVDGDKLMELELAEANAWLTLTVRGREHRFDLGGEVYGSSDRYARERDGRVVVFPAALTRDLDGGASRLMERRVIRATRPEVEALEISRLGSSVRIVQRGSADSAGAFWTLEGQESPSGEFLTWVDKFFRLQARGYRTGERSGDWRNEATITVDSREYGVDTLEIWSAEEPGERVWLARSAHTRLIAELEPSLTEEVCEDLESLVR